jgi:hypothetical protein
LSLLDGAEGCVFASFWVRFGSFSRVFRRSDFVSEPKLISGELVSYFLGSMMSTPMINWRARPGEAVVVGAVVFVMVDPHPQSLSQREREDRWRDAGG